MVILSVPEVLSKKRQGGELMDDEIEYFVECVCSKDIDRSQVRDTFERYSFWVKVLVAIILTVKFIQLNHI